jgi:hypothetical protein
MSAISITQNKRNAGQILRESFPVLEMSCAAYAVSVESTLKATNGVKDAGVKAMKSSHCQMTVTQAVKNAGSDRQHRSNHCSR